MAKEKQMWCKTCESLVLAKEKGLAWGAGDIILLLITGIIPWLLLKVIWHELSAPFLCQKCGTVCVDPKYK